MAPGWPLGLEPGGLALPAVAAAGGCGDPGLAGVAELLAGFAGGLPVSEAVAALAARRAGDERAGEAVLSVLPVAAAVAESERRWRDGTARALEGVPFGVKAIIDVAGAVVTCGSVVTGDRRAVADSAVVARLRAAGAIPLAMLATTEFAAGSPFNPRHGVVTNPWDAGRWTGGSSTGSGAALARRLVPLALGTDTGGSIRVPSCWCGTTGLKPTRGLLPRDGIATLSWTLDHPGPMARSARDLTLALGVLAGKTTVGPARGVRGLRVGLPSGWFDEGVDGAVLGAWRAAAQVMEAAGAALVPLDARGLDLGAHHDAAWDILTAEAAAVQGWTRARRGEQDAGLVARLERGEAVSGARYAEAMLMRAELMGALARVMEGVDVLLTPGLGGEAGRLADLTIEVDGRAEGFAIISRNTMVFDYTGFPALMMPAGLGPNGLPLGVQVVGRPGDDGLCLDVAMAFQQVTDFHEARP
ncbi:amidase [Rubellimicrobium aerolatum]|uniref:Amidase n=1 Tax=Rubellimicrobium aerolatum TaxID=490979 RepID=A0ABW0SCG1_9RHOB|nr:amidase [Rubellimicrobium aerolatum]MBP1806283.1 aspartyl-tRNA(Asn)/glutamyl-tRNA(Gln) amidotransferase subunit A [Rubellimicrobium aerolatum]